jgi:PIN domain nuclease of toxin-antitoxin system
MIYLDTHVVAWLYAGDLKKLNSPTKQLICDEQIFISPMVQLELTYLFEIKKITIPSKKVIQQLNQTIGLNICKKPFEEIIKLAEENTWTRDPFDRIITAQAQLNENILITKDRIIRKNYKLAAW